MKTKEEILKDKLGDFYYIIGKYRINVFESMQEYSDQQTKELQEQLAESELKLKNEILNSESLQRYWTRTKNELAAKEKEIEILTKRVG